MVKKQKVEEKGIEEQVVKMNRTRILKNMRKRRRLARIRGRSRRRRR